MYYFQKDANYLTLFIVFVNIVLYFNKDKTKEHL